MKECVCEICLFSYVHCAIYVYICVCVAEVSAMYERCCVLFNIGALQSQIAKIQNFDSDEGLKAAAKHFQVGGVGGCGINMSIFTWVCSAKCAVNFELVEYRSTTQCWYILHPY